MNKKTNIPSTFENRLLWSLIGLIIFFYVFLDLARKLLPISFVFYAVIDLLILLLYLTFTLWCFKNNLGRSWYLGDVRLLFGFLLILILALVLSSVLAASGSDLLSIFGIRTYLLGVPMIFVGYCLAYQFESDRHLLRIDKYLTKIFLFVCLLSFFQFGLLQFGVKFLPALEHEIHSFYTSEISLVSSCFVSSKKFARFVIFMFVLIWTVRTKLNKRVSYLSSLMILTVIISGSREGFILALVFLVVANSTRMHRLSLGKRKISNGLIKGTAALSLFVAFSFLILFTERFQFLFSTDDSLGIVVRIMQFMPFIWVDWSESQIWTGIGPGSYGHETKLMPEIREKLDGAMLGLFASDVRVGQSILAFADSGLTRVIVELGVLGLLAFVFYMLFVWFGIILKISRMNTLLIGFGFIVIFWLIFFLKAHPVIGDSFLSLVMYFAIGAFIFFRRKENLILFSKTAGSSGVERKVE